MQNTRKVLRRSTRGSVAIEMALILPLFLALLSVPLFYARVFWYYSAAEKAAHDAARYMSSVTQTEIRTAAKGFGEPNTVAVARWIAQQEMMDVVDAVDSVPIEIRCDPGPCGTSVPDTVRVMVGINMHDAILGDLSSEYGSVGDVVLVSDVTMPYLGKR